VAALFDGYAADFDEHLVERLHYRAHTLLVDGLVALGAGVLGHALDAGCGTGLVGPLLRPHVQRLSGVDLSARMLAQARRRGCYDALHQAELVQHLREQPAASCDAVVAADVLIYLGDLAPLLAAVRHALAPGGWFAFTVESLPGDAPHDYLLQPSSRYAHALPYLQRAAAAAGLAWQHQRAETLRLDQARPVPGLGVWLRRAGPASGPA
jgi:predicted TPR repeat methyltransferase